MLPVPATINLEKNLLWDLDPGQSSLSRTYTLNQYTTWLAAQKARTFVETVVSLDNPTPTTHPLHHTVLVMLISPDSEQCGEHRR